MLIKSSIVVGFSLILGIILCLFLSGTFSPAPASSITIINPQPAQKEVIGFLPFALLSRAQMDYSRYITTLAYFSLIIDTDGTIMKLSTPTQEEPGWYALSSGRADPFLQNAKQHNVALSLVLFTGNNATIDALMQDPVVNATNMTSEVVPMMDQYGFTNLNLDIESTEEASPAAQKHFVQFTKTLKDALSKSGGKTLTVDVTTVDLIKSTTLIRPKKIAEIADNIVIMAYDFHSTASYVSGPVAPLGGAGIESEYDVETAVQKALTIIPSQKIILGAPLYGYEWETLGNIPRSAVIPNTGQTASNKRAESLVASCATCSAQFDDTAQEAYVIYKDTDSQTYHQIFFPIEKSTSEKINYVQNNHLGGLALWALGYEGNTILRPLEQYLK